MVEIKGWEVQLLGPVIWIEIPQTDQMLGVARVEHHGRSVGQVAQEKCEQWEVVQVQTHPALSYLTDNSYSKGGRFREVSPTERSGSNQIIKFTDDATMIDLIDDNNEIAYRAGRAAGKWCKHNLSFNMDKTKEMIVDFRKVQTDHSSLIIKGSFVERGAPSFCAGTSHLVPPTSPL
ncbi:uncharacterized protein LOC132398489 isoform X2 [Hypanus sabinus]|uniref:uncharacterized protein LOC132398489 isoform X2 n=1 Tax=Hypanus sabinus TaxID=79690 RepID=UPI0028C3D811|nr:uncharacterized protein LOC132398489 isoform X2 [Hypanus sabinus]